MGVPIPCKRWGVACTLGEMGWPIPWERCRVACTMREMMGGGLYHGRNYGECLYPERDGGGSYPGRDDRVACTLGAMALAESWALLQAQTQTCRHATLAWCLLLLGHMCRPIETSHLSHTCMKPFSPQCLWAASRDPRPI